MHQLTGVGLYAYLPCNLYYDIIRSLTASRVLLTLSLNTNFVFVVTVSSSDYVNWLCSERSGAVCVGGIYYFGDQ